MRPRSTVVSSGTGTPADVSLAYDRWAATYDIEANRTRDLDAVVLRRDGPSVDGLDVLELGCGTGKNTTWLAGLARSVVAIDASPGMLAIARERVTSPHVRFIEHNICARLPIDDLSVDVAVIDLVLEHIQRIGDVFAEAARVLRPSGRLFVCELHPTRQVLGGRAHFTDVLSGRVVNVPVVRHTISEFINSGIDAGLSVERVGEWSDEARERGAKPDTVPLPPRLFSVLFRKPAGGLEREG